MTFYDAFAHQDEGVASAFFILQKAIAQHSFPAASIAVASAGRLIALQSFGTFTFEPDTQGEEISEGARPSSHALQQELARRTSSAAGCDVQFKVTPSTLFDIASLTKVVATTPMAMLLYERGLLDLDAPLAAVVPEFIGAEKDPRRNHVTLRMLLTHTSGLPAYEKLFLKTKIRDQLLHAALATPLAADPATRAVYSDIGFIILGMALERIADETLDRFCQREVFAPLTMTNTTFNPPAELRPKIPPTADERSPGSFRRRIIQGEVQDENASILGGVAAHAGVFSTARDLATFAHCMLTGGHPIFRPETVALFTRRESAPPGTTRALGWDTPSIPSQSGQYLSANSFGHLGYTGTSLWIDPARQLSITLLTNRTWPDCSNQAIKQIRPRFHDAVVQALDGQS